jgi:hypothetical protein
MIINNSLKNPRWYKIKCICNHSDALTEFPISDCLHCKFKQCEDSLPKKNFEIKKFVMKDGKSTGQKITKTINEITIVRGERFQDIIGWTYQW